MRKRKKGILIGFIAIISACLIVSIIKTDPLRETLIFFPIDTNVKYLEADTTLKVLSLKDEDEYTLEWQASSSLDQVAYLRQDLSLLYEDGHLKDMMSKWQEDNQAIKLKKRVKGEDSGHFEAISFHHAEMHYPDDEIKSSQTMSYDQLYVIDSPLAPLSSFKHAKTKKEKEGKKILDYIISQQLNYIWDELIAFYNIPLDHYVKIPLTALPDYQDSPLPGLTQEQTDTAIGGFWEGMYKNYFLGIQQSDGTIVSPIGSTLPLILLHESGDHVIIVFQTADGEKVQLLQTLSL